MYLKAIYALYHVLETTGLYHFCIFVQLILGMRSTAKVYSSKRRPCRLGINSGRIVHKLDTIPHLSSVFLVKNNKIHDIKKLTAIFVQLTCESGTDRIASRCSGFHLLPATRRVPPIWCLPARPITQRSEGVTIDKKLTDAVATGLG